MNAGPFDVSPRVRWVPSGLDCGCAVGCSVTPLWRASEELVYKVANSQSLGPLQSIRHSDIITTLSLLFCYPTLRIRKLKCTEVKEHVHDQAVSWQTGSADETRTLKSKI